MLRQSSNAELLLEVPRRCGGRIVLVQRADSKSKLSARVQPLTSVTSRNHSLEDSAS